MKKFMIFIGGLIALFILLVNLGPMVLLAASIWLLYVVFKRFLKSKSTAGKIGWIIVGLVVLSIVLSNIYAVIGLVAAYGLYIAISSWKKEEVVEQVIEDEDPFTNFERQWAELNH